MNSPAATIVGSRDGRHFFPLIPTAPGADAERRPTPFTERSFRNALAEFATGVTVICARAPDGRFVGFTANSFNSVSLAPPLILWSLACQADCLAAFEATERYAVNVLATDQVALAHRFSRPHADRFAGVDYRLGWADAPLIAGCVAWFECRHHSRQRAGDHVIFVGDVVACERSPGRALVFHHSRFGTTTPLPEAGPKGSSP